jgi:hypothetical protein
MPFAINKDGSEAVRLQLMSNLRDIEANPGDKSLQVEFLERRSVLWERMAEADQQTVDREHARVRAALKLRRPPAKRKPVPRASIG